jgi:hypothetical protein
MSSLRRSHRRPARMAIYRNGDHADAWAGGCGLGGSRQRISIQGINGVRRHVLVLPSEAAAAIRWLPLRRTFLRSASFMF